MSNSGFGHFRRRGAMMVALSLVLAISLAAGTAMAADISPEEFEAFEDHVERSGTMLREENYSQAIEELNKAIAIVDHPRIAMRIAQAYEDWGRCASAESAYDDLREREDIDDAMRDSIAESLENIDGCREKAPLEIRCEPEGADLQLSGDIGEREVSCPFAEDVPTGDYTVDASRDGYEDWSQDVTVRPVDGAQVIVELVEVEEEVTPVAEPEPAGDWSTPAGIGGMGAGAALLIGGFVLDYRSGARATELAQAREAGDQAAIEDLQGSATTARMVNIGLYAGGALLIAGGAVLYTMDFSQSDSPTSALAIGLGWQGLQATFQW